MDKRKIYPLSKVSVEDTKIELNCRAVKAIIAYLREHYGKEKLEDVIYETHMNLDYLENPHNWISFSYFCKLLKKLVEVTGDPKAPYQAGMYTCRIKTFGSLSNIASRFGSPGSMYRLTVEVSPMYEKIDTFKIHDLKKNSCTISLSMNEGYTQDKNNCLNLQGIFSSIPLLWNLPPAKVEEVKCAAEGADACEYKIKWRNRKPRIFGFMGFLIGVAVFGAGKLFFKNGPLFLLSMAPFIGYIIGNGRDYQASLKESMEINEEESNDLTESLEMIEKLNIELQEKVELRTEELRKTLDELKKSQEQLVQTEKMASVGRLAAGMAHELNNPVGAIRNYLQDVLEDLAGDSPVKERLERAERATDRCKRIVGNLLSFARENAELKPTNLKEIIRVAVQEARERSSEKRIEIIFELEETLPDVACDPMQMQQVFVNLINNAIDAIKNEGKIVIKTQSSADSILIEIKDSGEGIPKEIQNAIFDPFFTTKPTGQGMGLGLAISYNIIKRFNGEIHVESEEGKGSSFKITLPLKTEREKKDRVISKQTEESV